MVSAFTCTHVVSLRLGCFSVPFFGVLLFPRFYFCGVCVHLFDVCFHVCLSACTVQCGSPVEKNRLSVSPL